MDFSNEIFSPPQPDSTLSGDTMDHAHMVMACRFGWTASPSPHGQISHGPPNTHLNAPVTPFSNPSSGLKSNRFSPCRGRLYHQLTCSHRIRTDIVEECGPNCLEPLETTSNPPFICHECIENEAYRVWNEREAQLRALYPEIAHMTKEQYDHWYAEYRQLEALHANERATYELDLRTKTRPSNMCSAIEMSKEEMQFTAELDSLSLSLVSTYDSATKTIQPRSNRTSLPGDASEQLHWGLNSLDLDRGSCGIEYATTQASNGARNSIRNIGENELWRKPR
ncbi:hypothetical protein BCR34DRAFT_476321 [Clohesyomyces aquaticus]|uniref:Uncharacterized protein n=1 Tax=Clohesyomyces aquaticus TaxID=1231657 RepID=A0A1Y2A1T9_9PLEO|nr:hypothetical protein BCR34DRAFT_476321 [Clohesyomyces aquaticus]